MAKVGTYLHQYLDIPQQFYSMDIHERPNRTEQKSKNRRESMMLILLSIVLL